jgi:hypothetical protein
VALEVRLREARALARPRRRNALTGAGALSPAGRSADPMSVPLERRWLQLGSAVSPSVRQCPVVASWSWHPVFSVRSAHEDPSRLI